MKLMSMKQYGKMTKAGLVRKITKALKKLPKRTLIKMCYELEKKRLPTISTTKKGMPRLTQRRKAYIKKRKPKSKFIYPLAGTSSSWKYASLPRSAKQRANDKRLGRMAKARAKPKRRR
mgnify:FL=1